MLSISNPTVARFDCPQDHTSSVCMSASALPLPQKQHHPTPGTPWLPDVQEVAEMLTRTKPVDSSIEAQVPALSNRH